jgi:hypothetical protein
MSKIAKRPADETTLPGDGYALPTYGRLRGKRVKLADAESRLSKADLGEVTAVVDGNVIRPFRFASSPDEVVVKDDRVLI